MARIEVASERANRKITLLFYKPSILFNKRDHAAAEPFWSPKDIQHGAHIAPGREGLFKLFVDGGRAQI